MKKVSPRNIVFLDQEGVDERLVEAVRRGEIQRGYWVSGGGMSTWVGGEFTNKEEA
jgi:hypothetical protein